MVLDQFFLVVVVGVEEGVIYVEEWAFVDGDFRGGF